jgi:hypothetical protein
VGAGTSWQWRALDRRLRIHACTRCARLSCHISRAECPLGDASPRPWPSSDCKAPGPVRDRIAKCQHEWVKTLERAARNAGAHGQLRAGSDPRRLAFELEGALLTASWYFHLYGDPGYLSRACRAYMPVADEATPAGRRVLRSAPPTAETSATGVRATHWEQR